MIAGTTRWAALALAGLAVAGTGCTDRRTATPAPSTSPAGTSTSPSPTSPPQTTEESIPERYVESVTFQTPSGNFACRIDGRIMVTCSIHALSWTPPPRPVGCEGDWPAIIVLGDPPRLDCASDEVSGGYAAVLPYGETIHVGDVRCTIRRDGLRCELRSTGRGFFINQARYEFF